MFLLFYLVIDFKAQYKMNELIYHSWAHMKISCIHMCSCFLSILSLFPCFESMSECLSCLSLAEHTVQGHAGASKLAEPQSHLAPSDPHQNRPIWCHLHRCTMVQIRGGVQTTCLGHFTGIHSERQRPWGGTDASLWLEGHDSNPQIHWEKMWATESGGGKLPLLLPEKLQAWFPWVKDIPE